MRLNEILNESENDTDVIRRLIQSGRVRIPLDSETDMPVPSYPEAWKDFFEGEKDYGANLDAVDWEPIHREFYV